MSEQQTNGGGLIIAPEAQTTSVSFDTLKSDPKISSGEPDASSIEFGPDGKPVYPPEVQADFEEDAKEEKTSETEAKEETAKAEEGEKTGEEEAGEGGEVDAPLEGLAAYEPGNEEVAAAYDAKYFSEDGTTLNFEAFNAEFEANLAQDKIKLNDNTVAYLKDRLGISDKLIEQHLKGLVAQRDAADAAFYGAVGGKEAYDSMVAWGSENYSDAQKARFNEALKAGGDVLAEQLELLKTRYAAKNPGKGSEAPKGDTRRPGAPKRSATSNGSAAPAPKVEPFKNLEEHRVAQQAAMMSDNPPAELAKVRARLQASPNLFGGK